MEFTGKLNMLNFTWRLTQLSKRKFPGEIRPQKTYRNVMSCVRAREMEGRKSWNKRDRNSRCGENFIKFAHITRCVEKIEFPRNFLILITHTARLMMMRKMWEVKIGSKVRQPMKLISHRITCTHNSFAFLCFIVNSNIDWVFSSLNRSTFRQSMTSIQFHEFSGRHRQLSRAERQESSASAPFRYPSWFETRPQEHPSLAGTFAAAESWGLFVAAVRPLKVRRVLVAVRQSSPSAFHVLHSTRVLLNIV